MPESSLGSDSFETLQAGLATQYRLLQVLGRGGTAVVYLADDLRHDRQVAIKVLYPQIAAALGAKRFLQEIRITAQLDHPDIIPLIESGESNGLLYYVMPHVQGESLRERINREKFLPIEEALRIVSQVGGALTYAHQSGIIHRDIKPGNILLSGDRTWVADFGLAKALAQASSDGTSTSGVSVGTPQYMSPEQGAGSAGVDHRTDIYALGCVLFEMLTGEPPFSGATVQAVMAKHQVERIPSVAVVRPTVPPEIGAAISRSLAKLPVDRFDRVEDFLQALQSRGPARPHLQRMLAIAGATVALFLAAFFWLQASPGRGTSSTNFMDPGTIAVLYFDDATPDSSLRWLSRGLTEDLIDALAAVRGFTIASRGAVQQYEGKPVSPAAIGRALNVNLLIDGSVGFIDTRKDSVRFLVRVVDARSGVQLERVALVRPASEPPVLRRDLSRLMEVSLRRRIGTWVRTQRERVAAGSDANWELLQHARDLRAEALGLEGLASASRLRQADSLLIVAEKRGGWVEPTLERAVLSLSRAIIVGTGAAPKDTLRFDGSSVTHLGQALAHANRALQRDSGNPVALGYRGEITYRLWQFRAPGASDTTLTSARADLVRATIADPGLSRAWYALSEAYLALGNAPEAGIAARKALAADIFAGEAPAVMNRLLFTALSDGNITSADTLCSMGRLHFPSHPAFQECRLTVLGWLGSGQQAIARAATELKVLDTVSMLTQTKVQRKLLFAAVLARSGFADSSRAVAARTLATNSSSVTTNRDLWQYLAYLELLRGNKAQALEMLRNAVKENPDRRTWLADHPWFRELRNDSAFTHLVPTAR